MKNGPYIMIIAPNDYPGKLYRNKYIYEHHYVWWKYKNKIIEKGFIIHHKNHNKHDNSIENLEILSIKEHNKLHIRKTKLIELVCGYCNQKFDRKLARYKQDIKSGSKKFYCCIMHGGYGSRY